MSFSKADIEARAQAIGFTNIAAQLTLDLRVRIEANMIADRAAAAMVTMANNGISRAQAERIAVAFEGMAKALTDNSENISKGVAAEASVAETLAQREARQAAAGA